MQTFTWLDSWENALIYLRVAAGFTERCLFLKRLKVVLRDVSTSSHIIGAPQKQKIIHIPCEIIDKLRQLLP